MNKLLSINYKFFKQEPQKLIEIINKYNKNRLIQGFEIAVSKQEEQKYLLEFAKKLKKYNYILNLHAPTLENIEQYQKYLDYTVEISKITTQKTNIVFHPINAKNILKSKEQTNKYVKELLKYIEQKNYEKNIELSIENLNDIKEEKRLKKEDITDILNQNQELKFTYDIGHELVDGQIPQIEQEILKEKINNIHIHTHIEKKDHYPLIKNKKDKEVTIQIIEKIKKHNENINVVMEYALDYIEGNTFEEKIKNYINEANYMNL